MLFLISLPHGSRLFPRRSTAFRFTRENGGASAVEFAILSPVFIFLMLGMIAYGIYLGAVHSVQQLAADAARASVAGITHQERQEITSRFIAQNAGSYLLLQPALVDVSVVMNANDPTQFNVSVGYDASTLPIWSFGLGLPLPSQRIVRTSTIRIGGA